MSIQSHDRLREAAKLAIDRIHCDKSVPFETALESLADVQEHISTIVECLEHDITERDNGE